MIGAGTPAPPLQVSDQFGALRDLKDHLGKWVVVWWYPKALTPGCTNCGRAFQQALYDFQREDADIIGVSYDTPEENLAFTQAHHFDFPLLSATKADAERWGALRDPASEWADFPLRVSYLIDPDGVIAKAYQVGDPARHPDEVLADLIRLREERQPKGFLDRLLRR